MRGKAARALMVIGGLVIGGMVIGGLVLVLRECSENCFSRNQSLFW